jgi:hypothetical protein
VRQHCHGRFLRPYSLNRIETVHVANSIHNRINLPRKPFPMLQSSLTRTNLDLPSRVEVIGAREDNVGMMQIELSRKTHKTAEGIPHEAGVCALRRRHVGVGFAPDDTVIPDLKCTSSFDFADNAVCSAHLVMRCLENCRNFFGYWKGKYKQIYISGGKSGRYIERIVLIQHQDGGSLVAPRQTSVGWKTYSPCPS